MTFSRKVTCPYCGASDRVAAEDWDEQLECRSCGRQMFASKPGDLDEAELNDLLADSDIPVLVDFWAPWCGPCKAMAPAYEQAARTLESQLTFAKLNTDENHQAAQQHGIRSIPTMILFRNGEEIARHSGAMTAQAIEGWVSGQLAEPEA